MAPPGPNRVKLTKIFCHACFQCKIEFKSGFVFFNFWISGLLTYRKSETQERQNDRKTDNKRERLNNKKMERERECMTTRRNLK